jgi:DNA-binding transcriptional ArsR family regulator
MPDWKPARIRLDFAAMINFASGNAVAEVAALIGDVARANILAALMDGRALTATELAAAAGVSAQTTSGHLARLVEAELVVVEKQGRHRYHRLASTEISDALEALMRVAAIGPVRHRPTGPEDEAMRFARTCYDHLAGRLSVEIAAALKRAGVITMGADEACLGPKGEAFFCDFGIPLDAGGKARRHFCKTCVDWSERRPHLAGRLGNLVTARLFDLGWVEREEGQRAVTVTPAGRRGLVEVFGLPAEVFEAEPVAGD